MKKIKIIESFASLLQPLPSKRAFEEYAGRIKELILSKQLRPAINCQRAGTAVHFRTADGRTGGAAHAGTVGIIS